VGRGRHDNLDSIDLLEPRERRKEVLIVGLDEVPLCAFVEIGPGLGGVSTVPVPRRFELLPIRERAGGPFIQVRDESVAEPRSHKHLGEDGRNADRDRSLATFFLKAIQEPQDREIAFGRGLVEPCFPVRPTAVAEDPG